MDMVKLVKGDRVIERRKVDYENNKNIWGLRGWKLDDGKPKAPPKPKMSGCIFCKLVLATLNSFVAIIQLSLFLFF